MKDIIAKDEAVSMIAASQEQGSIVIATRVGIKHSLATKQFRKDSDLSQFRSSFKGNI